MKSLIWVNIIDETPGRPALKEQWFIGQDGGLVSSTKTAKHYSNEDALIRAAIRFETALPIWMKTHSKFKNYRLEDIGFLHIKGGR